METPDTRLVALHAENGSPHARLSSALAALEGADWGLLLHGEAGLARQLSALLGAGTLRIDPRLKLSREVFAAYGLALATIDADWRGAKAVWLLEPNERDFKRAARSGVPIIADNTLAPGGGWLGQSAQSQQGAQQYLVYRDGATLSGFGDLELSAIFGTGKAPVRAAPAPSDLSLAMVLRDLATLPLRLARAARTTEQLAEQFGGAAQPVGPTALLLAPDSAADTLAPLGGVLAAAAAVPAGTLLTPGVQTASVALSLLRQDVADQARSGAQNTESRTDTERNDAGRNYVERNASNRSDAGRNDVSRNEAARGDTNRNERSSDQRRQDGPQQRSELPRNELQRSEQRHDAPRPDTQPMREGSGRPQQDFRAPRPATEGRPESRSFERQDNRNGSQPRPAENRQPDNQPADNRPDDSRNAERPLTERQNNGKQSSDKQFNERPNPERASSQQANRPATRPALNYTPEIVFSHSLTQHAPAASTELTQVTPVSSGPDEPDIFPVMVQEQQAPQQAPEPAAADFTPTNDAAPEPIIPEPEMSLPPDLPPTPAAGSSDVISGLDEQQQAHFARLRDWRNAEAKRLEISRFIVASNATLADIALRNPQNEEELRQVRGMGPERVRKYGEAILTTLRR